jgi:hypothetical protein
LRKVLFRKEKEEKSSIQKAAEKKPMEVMLEKVQLETVRKSVLDP